jgi:hypothetical protein
MIDPLFGSWLRRALPAASIETLAPEVDDPVRALSTRMGQFAKFYVSHSSPVVDIEPLAVTREWTSVRNVALMRRGLEVARSGAAFPLHLDTLAALEAETWGAFLMSSLLAELQGRLDCGGIDGQQRALLRLVAPLTQLTTGKQAVSVLIELVDGVRSTGAVACSDLPDLLQSAQQRQAGELTTDALAIEALSCPDLHDALAALMGRASSCLRSIREPRLAAAGRQAVGALERAALWLESGKEHDVLEAGARRLAMTLARGLQLALLCEHAQWMLDHGGDRRGFAAALRYSRLPVDMIHEVDPELDRLLLGRG